jgi:hypothetical protein
MKFSKLEVTPIDSDYWRLDLNLRCTIDDTHFILVPKGFITDFASTPKILWGLLPPWDQHYRTSRNHP